MNTQAIFGLQFVLSLVVWGFAVGVLLRPWLAGRTRREALLVFCLPHTFRHVGMVFMVPGVVGPDMPASFAAGAAYGDLATGLLALVAVLALQRRWRAAIPAVWLVNIVGVLDLSSALRQTEAVSSMGAAWYIPTMLVPLLLVTHALMIGTLLTTRRSRARDSPACQGLPGQLC